jgi:hypothetical protein
MLALENRFQRPNDETALWSEALGAVGATAVFQQGSMVVHSHVRGLGQRHFMSVNLKHTA